MQTEALSGSNVAAYDIYFDNTVRRWGKPGDSSLFEKSPQSSDSVMLYCLPGHQPWTKVPCLICHKEEGELSSYDEI